MVSPLDEYPIHQVPLPVTWAGTSDRNFYDRCYFNAHDRTGDVFLVTGVGDYPNLGVNGRVRAPSAGATSSHRCAPPTRSTTTASTNGSAATGSR